MQCRGYGGPRTSHNADKGHPIGNNPGHLKLSCSEAFGTMPPKSAIIGPTTTATAVSKSKRKQAAPQIPRSKKRTRIREPSHIAYPNTSADTSAATASHRAPQNGHVASHTNMRTTRQKQRCPICFLWDCEEVQATMTMTTGTPKPAALKPRPKRALMPELQRSLSQARAQLKATPPTLPARSADLPPRRQNFKVCAGMCDLRCAPQCREKCVYPAGHRELHCCPRCMDGPQPPQTPYATASTDNPNAGTIWRISPRGASTSPTAFRHAQHAAAAFAATADTGSASKHTIRKARSDLHDSRHGHVQPRLGGSGLCSRTGSTANGQILAAALFWACVGAARAYEFQQLAHDHRITKHEALCNRMGYKWTEQTRSSLQQPQGTWTTRRHQHNHEQEDQRKHQRETTQTTITWWINDETKRSRPCTSTCIQGPTPLANLKTQVCKAMGLQSSDWYISGHTRHQSDLDAGRPNMQVNLSVRGKGGGYDHDIKPIDLITFRRDTHTSFDVDEYATVPATMVEQARSILAAAAIITTHPLEAIDNLQNCSVLWHAVAHG